MGVLRRGSYIDNTNTCNMNKWISVKDRLPENSDDVLSSSKRWGLRFGQYDESQKRWTVDGVYSPTSINVTHWISIPRPPKTNEA